MIAEVSQSSSDHYDDRSRQQSRHVGLIISSDPQLSMELGDLLSSLGHEHFVATTKQQALTRIKDDLFCYIFVDLVLRAYSDSPRARIETGLSLLSRLRAYYLDQTARKKFRTQIFALRDIDKLDQSMAQVMQLGANELVVKPLSKNQPSIYDKIVTALRHSERLSHKKCIASPTRAAEAPTRHTTSSLRYRDAIFFPATDAEYESIKNDTALLIDLKRRRVFYRGHEIPTRPSKRCSHLQNQPFFVLAILAMHHGQQVSEVRLDEILDELGLLDPNVGTTLRGLKRRIVQPFCEALAHADITQRELKGLVMSIRGAKSLILEVPGSVRVIGLEKLGDSR